MKKIFANSEFEPGSTTSLINGESVYTEVSDMDDCMFNEKQAIIESAKSLKKYGSTCNHVRNNEMLIKHEVRKSDTLQGIALKYGCTTEQIRRANRLFASDSLFIRQYLLIPIDKSSPYYSIDELQQRPQSLPPKVFSTAVMSPEDENKKSIDEFLEKIDSTIAESRKYVAKSQHKSRDFSKNVLKKKKSYKAVNFNCNDKNIYVHLNCRYCDSIISQSGDLLTTSGDLNHDRTHSSSSASHHRHSSSGNTTDTVHMLNITQCKRVQNSLQRLEKQQDEFFEL